MTNPSTAKDSSLENRIVVLEDSLARVNEFNHQVTAALKHALEQLKQLDTFANRMNQGNQRFEAYRTAQTLARASQIFPKTRTVVFVSKGYFGDNVKYAYLAFCDYARGKNINVQFVTDDKRQRDMLKGAGLPCLPCSPAEWSIEDVRTLFSAKVAVLGDNFHWQSMQTPHAWGMLQGAKAVQMWHGIPIKEIGMRYVLRGDNVILDELAASSGPFELFVATAKDAHDEWAQRFAFHEYTATGYPRNDVFFRPPTSHDLLNVDLDTLKVFQDARRTGKPCIIYTPTYRDDSSSSWFAKAGIERFAEHAKAKDYAFVVNLHPYEQVLTEEFRTRYPNIRFVAPGTDIYPIVRSADILFTDYSSLMFDFLLLDRPVVFYRPDNAITQSRGFIEGRVNETPGAVASNPDELIAAIDGAVGFVRVPENDTYRTARHDLRKRLFDHIDGKSAERLCDRIMELVE